MVATRMDSPKRTAFAISMFFFGLIFVVGGILILKGFSFKGGQTKGAGRHDTKSSTIGLSGSDTRAGNENTTEAPSWEPESSTDIKQISLDDALEAAIASLERLQGPRVPKRPRKEFSINPPTTPESEAFMNALRSAKPEKLQRFMRDYLTRLQHQLTGGADASSSSPERRFLAEYVVTRGLLEVVSKRSLDAQADLSMFASLFLSTEDPRSLILGALIPSIFNLPGLADQVVQEIEELSLKKPDSDWHYEARHQIIWALSRSGDLRHVQALVRMSKSYGDEPSVASALFSLGNVRDVLPHFLEISRSLLGSSGKFRLDEVQHQNWLRNALMKDPTGVDSLQRAIETEQHDPTRRFLFLTWVNVPPQSEVENAAKSDYLFKLVQTHADEDCVNASYSYLLSRAPIDVRLRTLHQAASNSEPSSFARRFWEAWGTSNSVAQEKERIGTFAATLRGEQQEAIVAYVESGLGNMSADFRKAMLNVTRSARYGDLLRTIEGYAHDEALKRRIAAILDVIGSN